MLLAVLAARRMTRDADLSAHGIPNDEPAVAAVVAEIAATALPESDGIAFDPASITTETMREGATYSGVRAKLPARIGVARVLVTLDFSFGDPGSDTAYLRPAACALRGQARARRPPGQNHSCDCGHWHRSAHLLRGRGPALRQRRHLPGYVAVIGVPDDPEGKRLHQDSVSKTASLGTLVVRVCLDHLRPGGLGKPLGPATRAAGRRAQPSSRHPRID
jgi:Nucleotidyl transferase AbiEii toxin, Type IV TA system